MKIARNFCILMLLSIAGCVTGPVCPDADLAGYWSFDDGNGVVARNSAGDNDGKVNGGLSWVAGKRGKALEFDGKGYVFVDHREYFNSRCFTVCAWIKVKDTGHYQYIIWKNGPDFPDTTGRRIDLWVTIGGSVNVMWNADGTMLEDRIYGRTVVADDKWHHVAEVYDGTHIKLYIDGALDTQDMPSGSLPFNQEGMWIGARPGGVAASGIIDEVRFYKRALSSLEISTLAGADM